MATQPDFELQGDAVIDEDQFQEQAEGLQYEMQGDAESIDTAQSQNEETNDKLGIIGRGVISLLAIFSKIGATIAVVLVVLKNIANAFDLSFEDIRSAIVGVLNTIVETLKGIFGTSESDQKRREDIALGGAVGSITSPGLGLGIGGSIASIIRGLDRNEEINLDLSLPRDIFQGDSTQQDKETDTQNNTIFDWGT